jgi:hypothetical protein
MLRIMEDDFVVNLADPVEDKFLDAGAAIIDYEFTSVSSSKFKVPSFVGFIRADGKLFLLLKERMFFFRVALQLYFTRFRLEVKKIAIKK